MKKTLISTLLICLINIGYSLEPITYMQYFNSDSWPGSYDNNAHLHNHYTGLYMDNVMGSYTNRNNIWGDYQYGAYIKVNSASAFSLFNNYGNVSSEYQAGIALVGNQGQLNNWYGGTIYGGLYGVKIDPEDGSSVLNDFYIHNEGFIEAAGTGIYQANDKKKLTINNLTNAYIGGDTYGILAKNAITLNNQGTIESRDNAAIWLIRGRTTDSIIDNTGGFIESRSGDESIKTNDNLTLKGGGVYVGDIVFNGDPAWALYNSNLTLLDNSVDFTKYRLRNWLNINVNNSDVHFNIVNDFNYNYTTNININDGSILGIGDVMNDPKDQGDPETIANFNINNGFVNPYENSYTGKWNYSAPKYNKRQFEKLTINNLTVGAQGGFILEFKDARGLWDFDYWVENWDDGHEGHDNPDDSYGGYGNVAYQGTGNGTKHRILYDNITVKGNSTIADGATLHIVDYTMTDMEIEPFDNLQVNLLHGNISVDDFSNFEFYSDYYGIDKFENGSLFLRRSLHDPESQKGLIEWWLSEIGSVLDDIGESVTSVTSPSVASVQTASVQTMQMATVKALEPMATVKALEAVEPVAAVEAPKPYEIQKDYNIKITDLTSSYELRDIIYSFTEWADLDLFLDSINKLEYASLAANNLNSINTRVNSIYDRLGNYNKGLDIWVDYYMTDSSLQGDGNHDISGRGYEVSAGVNKSITDNIVFGVGVNHTDYTSTVNDSGMNTNINSEGYGFSVFGLYQQNAKLTHKFSAGMTNYLNENDVADFNSTEMFASYRTEYKITINQLSITPLAGLRYASVKYDTIAIDADNGLEGFTHNSLETEFGLKLNRQFKKLNVGISGAWLHEMLDTSNTSTAYTSHGNFEQTGIERDADSFEVGLNASFQITNKVALDFDYIKEFSSNSNNNSINAKLTFSF